MSDRKQLTHTRSWNNSLNLMERSGTNNNGVAAVLHNCSIIPHPAAEYTIHSSAHNLQVVRKIEFPFMIDSILNSKKTVTSFIIYLILILNHPKDSWRRQWLSKKSLNFWISFWSWEHYSWQPSWKICIYCDPELCFNTFIERSMLIQQ